MKTRAIVVGIAVMSVVVMAVWVQAQAPTTPTVSDDAKHSIQILAQRAVGLTDARAVLQKELDAVMADMNRGIQQLQAQAPEGYVLDVPTLTYVTKKKDEAGKK